MPVHRAPFSWSNPEHGPNHLMLILCPGPVSLFSPHHRCTNPAEIHSENFFFFFPKASLISSITRVSTISLTVLFFLIETWLLDVESLMHLYADDISIFTE